MTLCRKNRAERGQSIPRPPHPPLDPPSFSLAPRQRDRDRLDGAGSSRDRSSSRRRSETDHRLNDPAPAWLEAWAPALLARCMAGTHRISEELRPTFASGLSLDRTVDKHPEVANGPTESRLRSVKRSGACVWSADASASRLDCNTHRSRTARSPGLARSSGRSGYIGIPSA